MRALTDRADSRHGPQVRRRPNLPNGRVVAGGLLVAAAAVLVFGAWLRAVGGQGSHWVVADRPLAAGTTLVPEDLTTADMRLPAGTASHAYGRIELVVGRTLASPLASGELVQYDGLVGQGQEPSLRPVPVTVDGGDASVLAVGNLVDVLVTNGSDAAATTSVVVRGARVLDAGQVNTGITAATSGQVVTLGVGTFAEVTAIVHAERTGTINVVPGEPSDGSGPGSSSASGGAPAIGPSGPSGVGVPPP